MRAWLEPAPARDTSDTRSPRLEPPTRPPPGFAEAPRPGSRLALPAPPTALDPGRDLTRDVRWRDARFDEVLDRTKRSSTIDHLRLSIVGEDHDRRVAGKPFVERSQHLEPTSIGKEQVEEDNVRRVLRHGREPNLSRAGDGDAVAVVLELDAVHIGDRGVVFDHQDMGRQTTTGKLRAGQDRGFDPATRHQAGLTWEPERKSRGHAT